MTPLSGPGLPPPPPFLPPPSKFSLALSFSLPPISLSHSLSAVVTLGASLPTVWPQGLTDKQALHLIAGYRLPPILTGHFAFPDIRICTSQRQNATSCKAVSNAKIANFGAQDLSKDSIVVCRQARKSRLGPTVRIGFGKAQLCLSLVERLF